MELRKEEINSSGVKLILEDNGTEIARGYLYLLRNDLHKNPFGFMEDIFVQEEFRGQGNGARLVNEIISEAKKRGCYKLICTSRHEKVKVHGLYKGLGFKDHGKEFRI